MYKNYIFDLYGTLVDINTDENKVELWEKLSLFYSLKGAIYGAEELKNTYLEKVKNEIELIKDSKYPDFPLEKVFYSLYEDKGITASDEIVEDTAQFFRVLSINYIKLYDGVIELLEELKAKGKKIYLLSNAQRVFTLFEMRMLGIEKYFDDILFSADYKVCKPDSKFYKILLDKHKLDIKESIMIGNDYICDIEGANNVGLDSLYLHSNLSPEIKGQLKSTYSIMEIDISKVAGFTIEIDEKQ